MKQNNNKYETISKLKQTNSPSKLDKNNKNKIKLLVSPPKLK